jgi:hypothetical protein
MERLCLAGADGAMVQCTLAAGQLAVRG